MENYSLKDLRKIVPAARKREAERKEKQKLERELFELNNPRRVAFRKGAIRAGDALGKGTVRAFKGIRKFAVEKSARDKARDARAKKVRVGKNTVRRRRGVDIYEPFGGAGRFRFDRF